MVCKLFDKKSPLLTDDSASGGDIKYRNMLNQELAEELHKPIFIKFEKGKACPSFNRNKKSTIKCTSLEKPHDGKGSY